MISPDLTLIGRRNHYAKQQIMPTSGLHHAIPKSLSVKLRNDLSYGKNCCHMHSTVVHILVFLSDRG